MKINQIRSNNYSSGKNFCGRLALNSGDGSNDIEVIDTKKVKYISKAPNDCFKTAIQLTNKGNIVVVDHNLSDVLEAYTAASQDELVTIDISSRYAK